MKLLEVFDLAMEGIILKMQNPYISAAEHKELNAKLKEVAAMYVKEQNKNFLENLNKPIDK